MTPAAAIGINGIAWLVMMIALSAGTAIWLISSAPRLITSTKSIRAALWMTGGTTLICALSTLGAAQQIAVWMSSDRGALLDCVQSTHATTIAQDLGFNALLWGLTSYVILPGAALAWLVVGAARLVNSHAGSPMAWITVSSVLIVSVMIVLALVPVFSTLNASDANILLDCRTSGAESPAVPTPTPTKGE